MPRCSMVLEYVPAKTKSCLWQMLVHNMMQIASRHWAPSFWPQLPIFLPLRRSRFAWDQGAPKKRHVDSNPFLSPIEGWVCLWKASEMPALDSNKFRFSFRMHLLKASIKYSNQHEINAFCAHLETGWRYQAAASVALSAWRCLRPYLGGGWPTALNMRKSIRMILPNTQIYHLIIFDDSQYFLILPNIWKNNKCSTNQMLFQKTKNHTQLAI